MVEDYGGKKEARVLQKRNLHVVHAPVMPVSQAQCTNTREGTHLDTKRRLGVRDHHLIDKHRAKNT